MTWSAWIESTRKKKKRNKRKGQDTSPQSNQRPPHLKLNLTTSLGKTGTEGSETEKTGEINEEINFSACSYLSFHVV